MKTSPEMSDLTSEWLWRFTVCVGISRSDLSANVLRHVSESVELISRYRTRLLKTIPEHFDGPFSEDVLDSWLETLRTIQSIAATREYCTWQVPSRPGDTGYGSSQAETLNDLQSRLKKTIKRAGR